MPFSGRHDQIWDPRWSGYVADALPAPSSRPSRTAATLPSSRTGGAWNAALAGFIESTH